MQNFRNVTFLAVLLSCSNAFADDGRVILKSDKVAVTYGDMERYLVENTPTEANERAAVLSNPDIYGQMAESLYTVRALAEEAERTPGFDKEQADWTARVIYERRIATEYRKTYVQHVLKNVDWEASAKEAYQADQKSYMTDEMINASHILITTKTRSEDEAKQVATELRARALKGENFPELATENSEDPSAQRNAGSLGFFKRGQMVKPFDDVVFAMDEEGSISELVRSPFGYHIIQYHSKKPAQPIPFDSIKDDIAGELQKQMSKKVWEDKLIAIRSSSDIVVDGELIEELKKQYQPEDSRK